MSTYQHVYKSLIGISVRIIRVTIRSFHEYSTASSKHTLQKTYFTIWINYILRSMNNSTYDKTSKDHVTKVK